jgi:mRNA-degrading endonuclease RelE of RelBE toxin-antitoxin system
VQPFTFSYWNPLPGYTSQGIVYTLKVHKDARADLEEIGKARPNVPVKLYALLAEIGGSQILLDALTVKNFGLAQNEKIHVDSWVELQRTGRNIWRIKAWELEAGGDFFRVIYCLDPRVSTYYVLAVVPRKFDYDTTAPRVIKLLDVYDTLGIPSYF